MCTWSLLFRAASCVLCWLVAASTSYTAARRLGFWYLVACHLGHPVLCTGDFPRRAFGVVVLRWLMSGSRLRVRFVDAFWLCVQNADSKSFLIFPGRSTSSSNDVKLRQIRVKHVQVKCRQCWRHLTSARFTWNALTSGDVDLTAFDLDVVWPWFDNIKTFQIINYAELLISR